MATNNPSAQQAFLNQLKKGRITQSQAEAGQRYADNSMPGYNFDSKLGYYKGTKPSSSPSSAQRSAQRSAKSAATGNSITKGGAAGLARALGQYDTLEKKALMAKMMFNSGSLTDAEKSKLALKEIGKYYDNVPSGGLFDMVAEGRDPSKQYYSDGTYADQVLSTTVPSQAMGGQTSITSGLEGLSMPEKDLLSSQGQLGSSFQSGPQMDSPFNTGNSDKRQESTVGYRADGGPVEAGQPYIVGERGPELIYPSQDGNVLSNEMLQLSNQSGIDPSGLSEEELRRLLAQQSEITPQVPMLGGFEVRGDGAERFALGTPEVPETLSSELYSDPSGNTAAIARIEAERAKALTDRQANEVAPQVGIETPFFQPTESGKRFASGVNSAKDAIFGAANSVSKAGGKFVNSTTGALADVINQSTGGMVDLTSSPEFNRTLKADVVPEINNADQLQTLMSGLNEQAAATKAANEITSGVVAEVPAVAPAPVVQTPNAQTMDSITGTGIDRLGLDPSVTAFGPVDPNVQTIQGVDETMNQQALLPEGLTASSPIPEGLVKAIGPDGKMILASPAEAARLNAIELQTQKDDRAVQQKFLASDKAREFSNRQIRSAIMGDGQYGRESLAREQRQADRPDFFEAQTRAVGTVTDRERRAARGEGMSDADRRDIAKANQKGANAGDVARGIKVAGLNNVDVKTGESLNKKDTRRPDQVEQDRLNLVRTQQIIEDGNKPDATPNQKLAAERQVAVGKRIITQAQADEANKIDLIGKPTNTLYDTWAEWEAATGIDQDKDGKVSTKEDAKLGRLSKVDQSRLQALRNKDKK